MLATGKVNDKLTVFVSDVDHRFNLRGSYRLEVYPSDGGRLQVSSHPMPLPSDVPKGSVNFVCKDSDGFLYTSSNKHLHFYVITSNENVTRGGFDSDPIANSNQCYDPGHGLTLCLLHHHTDKERLLWNIPRKPVG